MSQLSRLFPRPWLGVLVCACGYLFWCDHARIKRVDYVSGLAGRASATDLVDGRSPTGYAHSQRELIIPERNQRSFDWIAQTQQMFAQGEGRVRHVEYDNALEGREVNAPSPYRWWLGLLAWCDHAISGRPIGLSVERAVLWADPLLHALLLIGGTCFVAWRFGGFAAALFSIGVVTLFPFAGDFLPGMPDDRGLSHACVLISLLLLLAGLTAFSAGAGATPALVARGAKATRRWFALAGVIGGLGVWISAPVFVPLIAGIFVGALVSAWVIRSLKVKAQEKREEVVFPWRAWSLAGGLTVLIAYLVEYFPAHMDFARLESVHPFYGLAWIGLGELLFFLTAWIQRRNFPAGVRDRVVVVAAILVIAAIPLTIWKTGNSGFLTQELSSVWLTHLSGGVAAPDLSGWLSSERTHATVWITLFPLTILILAGWVMFRSATKTATRLNVAIILGPVVVSAGFATQRLGWWSPLDCLLLVLGVAILAQPSAIISKSRDWLWFGLLALAMSGGVFKLLPPQTGEGTTLTASESQELIERHLAHWLAKRTGESGVVVYAPPHQTTTLCFYGGLRGIGSFAVENRDGFGATLMIAAMNTMEEAQGLLVARGVRYIVIPSWDPFFEEFAERYLAKNFSNRTSMLVRELRRWNLPHWLRAVPYQIPVSGGFEGQSVLVFEIVDEQSPVLAASRLAEYLVETSQLDAAASTAETLRRFPGDVGALVARAQVQAARGDAAGFTQTSLALQSRLSAGADKFLPWDRRVSLAVVLAKGEKIDPAREQIRRCLADVNEAKLRALTTGSLFGLEVLAKAFELKITDPRLNDLALSLLPDDLRERL